MGVNDAAEMLHGTLLEEFDDVVSAAVDAQRETDALIVETYVPEIKYYEAVELAAAIRAGGAA